MTQWKRFTATISPSAWREEGPVIPAMTHDEQHPPSRRLRRISLQAQENPDSQPPPPYEASPPQPVQHRREPSLDGYNSSYREQHGLPTSTNHAFAKAKTQQSWYYPEPIPSRPFSAGPYQRSRHNSIQQPQSDPGSQSARSQRNASSDREGRREQSMDRSGAPNRDQGHSSRAPSVERTNRHNRDQSQAPRGQSTERTNFHQRNPSRAARGESVERTNVHNRDHSRNPRGASRESSRHRNPVLRNIADTTIAAINSGIVDVSSTQKNTCLFLEDAPQLVKWQSSPRKRHNTNPVEINILPFTTLHAAQSLYSQHRNLRIGVLNFASATRPGGGFLNGAQAQEESIARSSTLYVSLTTSAARPFYALHARDEKGGFYTHSMIYSPAIHILRDDNGEWARTFTKVDVLTCAAVNAGDVRKYTLRQNPADAEYDIRLVMHERMGRILALFERKGARQLVLGSFGTGVFQNDVQSMAQLWRELLYAPGAPFAHSFDYVAFAIPDQETRRKFDMGFIGPGNPAAGHGSSWPH